MISQTNISKPKVLFFNYVFWPYKVWIQLVEFRKSVAKSKKIRSPPLYSVQYVHVVNIKIQYQKNDVENCVYPA